MPTLLSEVRYWVNSGKHVLAASISGFDPSATSASISCCDDCIAFHAKAAVEHGATKGEVSETLGMAIYMGAGPSVMYASHAFEAFTQFEASKQTQS